MGVLRFVLSLVLSNALSYAVQRWDRARLSPAQRERAWNTASWGAALYGFGPFSMVGWVCVTRIAAARWWPQQRIYAAGAAVLLVAAGLACAVVIFAVVGAADWLVARLGGVPF